MGDDLRVANPQPADRLLRYQALVEGQRDPDVLRRGGDDALAAADLHGGHGMQPEAFRGLRERPTDFRPRLPEHQRLAVQLMERNGPAPAPAVGFADDGDQSRPIVGQSKELGPPADAAEHGHIEMVTEQLFLKLARIGETERDVEPRIASMIDREQVDGVVRPIGADQQLPGAQSLDRLQIFHRILLVGVHPPHDHQQLMARTGERDAAPVSVKQLDAVKRFKLLDLRANGRLAHVEGPGGGGKAAGTGDRMKGASLCRRHRGSL